jgi:transcription initiation factor TFIIIB Brf1 subunit/transcription initiation factor TFIIB
MAKTIKEISDKFNVTERIIKRAFNNIKYDIVEPKADITEMIEAEKNFIRNFILENGLNFYVNNLSSNIIENMSKNCILEGKSPRTVAGIALFIHLLMSKSKKKACLFQG